LNWLGTASGDDAQIEQDQPEYVTSTTDEVGVFLRIFNFAALEPLNNKENSHTYQGQVTSWIHDETFTGSPFETDPVQHSHDYHTFD